MTSAQLNVGSGDGDLKFIDGKGLDGSPGTEALRLCEDGRFLVRSVETTDHALIVRALREWAVRVIDAVGPPSTDFSLPEEPIMNEGRVTLSARGELASIVIERDGGVYVNGTFVEKDERLRLNFRRGLQRLQRQT